MKQKLIIPPHSAPLKEQINSYLHDTVYMLLLALTAIGSYGFLISHFSVSIDDLRYDYYYYGGLLSQGRFTGSLVMRLFKLTDNIVWLPDLIGIVFLCLAAILLCAFFDSFYRTKNRVPQILFSCLLVSYPLHATLFTYGGCSIAFGVGLTMAVGALILIKEYASVRKIRLLVFAAVLLILCASWYESVLILYIQAVFAALLLFQLGTKRLKLSEWLANGLVYAAPLIVAVIAEFILSKCIIAIFKLPPSVYAGNQAFAWDLSDKTTLFDQLNYVVMGNYLSALIRALFFTPMVVFGGAFLLLFIVGLAGGIRKKSAALFLSFFGLVAVNFALPLLLGKVTPRTCQSFGFTVAFAAFLIYDFISARTKHPQKLLAKAVLIGLSCLIIGQTVEINNLFTADDMRYQQEKDIITGVGRYMVEHDLDDKPFVFAGRVDFSDSIKSRVCVRKDNKLFQALLSVPWLGAYCQGMADKRTDAYAFALQDNICISLINCDLINKTLDSEITLFLRYCGYDTVRYGTQEQQEAAQAYMTELPAWPREGAVKDMGDYVIVNLGESTMNWLS